MGRNKHPRVFISYRHSEKSGTPDAEDFNARHIAWVEKFARDLSALNVEPVLDIRIRYMFGRYFKEMWGSEPEREPAIANLALAAIPCCHAFLPIITPGWVERIGYGGFQEQRSWQDGYVFDEWQQAAAISQARKIQILPIFRSGGVEHALDLPFVMNAGIVFDFEEGCPYEDNLILLANFLHKKRAIKRPQIDKPVQEWLVEFLRKMQT